MSTNITEIVLPQLGANDQTVTIVEWLVTEGDEVTVGTELATLETTKASIQLEAEVNGFVYPLASAGNEYPVQDVIALVLPQADADAAKAHAERLATPSEDTDSELPAGVKLTDKARKLLGDLNVDPSLLPQGRILRERDIRALASESIQQNTVQVPQNALRRVAIYGASQGGMVVRECVEAMGGFEVVAYLDDTPGQAGQELGGIPIRPGSNLESLAAEGIGAIASHIAPRIFRLELRDRAHAAGLLMLNVIHPSTVIAPSVRMGQGNLIKSGAILDTDVSIGDCCIIDNGVIVPHHNTFGHAVHLAPGVSMGGDCTIGDRTLIGVGTSIASRISIGADVIVAPGSSLVRDVPDFAIMEGNPALQIGINKSQQT